MRTHRFSNLAALMAVMAAGIEQKYSQLNYGANEIANITRRAQRSLAKRHARFYGTNKKKVIETVNCQAAQRRRRHLDEGRYPASQILRQPLKAA